MSFWLLAAILLLLVAILLQVLIPRIGERRVARRLAENGGEAFVALAAFPALRLLRLQGERIMIRGRRLGIGMSREGGGLAVLDGFTHVDVEITDFTTGPFEVASFELTRSHGGPYLMRSEAVTSGVALTEFGSQQIGGLIPLLSVVAKQAPLGARPFNVSIEVELTSEDGLLTVAGGGGTVGGYPAGPIASMIAGAVARRLEIAF